MKVTALIVAVASLLTISMTASANFGNSDLCDDILHGRCGNEVIPSPYEPWDGKQRGDDWSPDVEATPGAPYERGAYDRDDADDMLRTIND